MRVANCTQSLHRACLVQNRCHTLPIQIGMLLLGCLLLSTVAKAEKPLTIEEWKNLEKEVTGLRPEHRLEKHRLESVAESLPELLAPYTEQTTGMWMALPIVAAVAPYVPEEQREHVRKQIADALQGDGTDAMELGAGEMFKLARALRQLGDSTASGQVAHWVLNSGKLRTATGQELYRLSVFLRFHGPVFQRARLEMYHEYRRRLRGEGNASARLSCLDCYLMTIHVGRRLAREEKAELCSLLRKRYLGGELTDFSRSEQLLVCRALRSLADPNIEREVQVWMEKKGRWDVFSVFELSKLATFLPDEPSAMHESFAEHIVGRSAKVKAWDSEALSNWAELTARCRRFLSDQQKAALAQRLESEYLSGGRRARLDYASDAFRLHRSLRALGHEGAVAVVVSKGAEWQNWTDSCLAQLAGHLSTRKENADTLNTVLTVMLRRLGAREIPSTNRGTKAIEDCLRAGSHVLTEDQKQLWKRDLVRRYRQASKPRPDIELLRGTWSCLSQLDSEAADSFIMQQEASLLAKYADDRQMDWLLGRMGHLGKQSSTLRKSLLESWLARVHAGSPSQHRDALLDFGATAAEVLPEASKAHYAEVMIRSCGFDGQGLAEASTNEADAVDRALLALGHDGVLPAYVLKCVRWRRGELVELAGLLDGLQRRHPQAFAAQAAVIQDLQSSYLANVKMIDKVPLEDLARLAKVLKPDGELQAKQGVRKEAMLSVLQEAHRRVQQGKIKAIALEANRIRVCLDAGVESLSVEQRETWHEALGRWYGSAVKARSQPELLQATWGCLARLSGDWADTFLLRQDAQSLAKHADNRQIDWLLDQWKRLGDRSASHRRSLLDGWLARIRMGDASELAEHRASLLKFSRAAGAVLPASSRSLYAETLLDAFRLRGEELRDGHYREVIEVDEALRRLGHEGILPAYVMASRSWQDQAPDELIRLHGRLSKAAPKAVGPSQEQVGAYLAARRLGNAAAAGKMPLSELAKTISTCQSYLDASRRKMLRESLKDEYAPGSAKLRSLGSDQYRTYLRVLRDLGEQNTKKITARMVLGKQP